MTTEHDDAGRAVFVDRSGRRAVTGRVVGVGVGVVVAGYLVAFALSLLGVSSVPRVNLPVVGDALPGAGSAIRPSQTPAGPELSPSESARSDVTTDGPQSSPTPTAPEASATVLEVTALGGTVQPPTPLVVPGSSRPPVSSAALPSAAPTFTADTPSAPSASTVSTVSTVQSVLPTDASRAVSSTTPAATAPRSPPPTSTPSDPPAATRGASDPGGRAPDVPPGRVDSPSVTAPGRP